MLLLEVVSTDRASSCDMSTFSELVDWRICRFCCNASSSTSYSWLCISARSRNLRSLLVSVWDSINWDCNCHYTQRPTHPYCNWFSAQSNKILFSQLRVKHKFNQQIEHTSFLLFSALRASCLANSSFFSRSSTSSSRVRSWLVIFCFWDFSSVSLHSLSNQSQQCNSNSNYVIIHKSNYNRIHTGHSLKRIHPRPFSAVTAPRVIPSPAAGVCLAGLVTPTTSNSKQGSLPPRLDVSHG